MTDLATEGSVAAEESTPAPAGNPDGADATRLTNGSGTEGADLWSGLQDEGNRSLVEAKGWKDKPLDDVVKSYRELESKLGQALAHPGENATDDEWDAFDSKRGVPENPEGYQFKIPEGIPEEMPYDAESAEKAKSWFKEARLEPWQAQLLHDKFLTDTAGRIGQMQTQTAEAVDTAHRAIVKEWGDPDSETYQRNVELADRAARKLGWVDALKRRGVLGQDNTVMDADFAFGLSKIGAELYSEDKLHGGPTATKNPFSEKHFNLTEQGKLVRSDPEMAKALIRSAGQNPKDFGLA